MFLFSFFFSLSLSHYFGFDSLLIEPGKKEVIDARNKTCIVMLPNLRPKSLSLLVNGTRSASVSMFIERNIQFSDCILTFTSNSSQEIKIDFWILPYDLCPINSFFFDNEYLLDLRAEIDKRKEPFCLFSKPSFELSKTNISIKYGIANIYDSDMKKSVCDMKCKYFSHKPFFIAINNSQKISFGLTMVNEVSEVYHCHLKPIIYYAGLVGIPGTFPGTVLSKVCTNRDEDLVPFAQFIFFIILVVTMSILMLFTRTISCCRRKIHRGPDTEYLMQ